jgi:hypothetical protein
MSIALLLFVLPFHGTKKSPDLYRSGDAKRSFFSETGSGSYRHAKEARPAMRLALLLSLYEHHKKTVIIAHNPLSGFRSAYVANSVAYSGPVGKLIFPCFTIAV